MGDLVKQPIEVLRQLYEWLGEPFSSEKEEAAKEWLTQNPQNKHGAHDYDATSFGLNEENIAATFAEYIQLYCGKPI